MRVKKILIRAGLAFIVIILLTELTLRLTISHQLQKWDTCQYQADSVLGYRYKVNSEGTVYNSAFSRPYKINSHGFAGHEFTTKKDSGIYRIAVVGASEETGLYTNGPLNYINVAEDIFNKNGYKVEIINLAMDGHGRGGRNVEFVKTGCAEYEPDLILFRDMSFPITDFMQYRTTYKGVLIKYTDTSQATLKAAKAYVDNELDHKDFRLYLYDYFYIYRYMAKFYLENYQKSKFWERAGRPFFMDANKIECYARHLIFWPKYNLSPTVYSVDSSLQIYKEVKEELLKRNTKLIVYSVYKIKDASEMKQLFGKHQLSYLPLEVDRQANFGFGKLDGHASQEGHKAIGACLYKALKDSIGINHGIVNK